MTPKLELPLYATFRTSGAWIDLQDGGEICVKTQFPLLEDGYCNVIASDPRLATAFNSLPHPEQPDLLICKDPRLVELAGANCFGSTIGTTAPPDTTAPILACNQVARQAWHERLAHFRRWIIRSKSAA